MDKQPMVLVHTCATSAEGDPRYRVRNRRSTTTGRFVKLRYKLHHPQPHALYRTNFNTVDKWNKHALGPRTIGLAIRTVEWWKRVWMQLLAACVCNAWLAYRYFYKHEQDLLDHSHFKKQLAEELLAKPWGEPT